MDSSVERRWERCRPQQIWDALAEFPCVYVPSGPLEWHGRQNAVGLDAVKSTAICRRAAERTGGLVYPTVFLGAWEVPWPLGMPAAPDLIQSNTRTVLDYLARNGVKVVIWLGGHGGSEDYLAYRRAALEAMRQSDILVLAAVDSQLLGDFEKPMDHAAAIETSIMMYLHPETVDLHALDPAPDKWPEGVGGDDPRTHASREKGRHYAETLIDRIADAARRLVALDDPVERRKHRQCVGAAGDHGRHGRLRTRLPGLGRLARQDAQFRLARTPGGLSRGRLRSRSGCRFQGHRGHPPGHRRPPTRRLRRRTHRLISPTGRFRRIR